jgi:hypothetical protein
VGGVFRLIPGQPRFPGDRGGSLLLIERKENHQVSNTGRGLLRTLNFYVPPAYRRDGNPRSRGKK